MAALYETRKNGAFVHQTTGIQNLDVASYLSMKVAVPGFDAQQGVARDLDQARARSRSLRDALNRSNSLLAERRQALITAAVTGRLDVTTAGGITS